MVGTTPNGTAKRPTISAFGSALTARPRDEGNEHSNTLFALIYLLDPGGISNARPGSFEDAFFFSVQTLATIGYGTMAPQTTFTHVLVTVESILGVIAVGSLAGVAFARLSRPQARVLFTNKIVIRKRNGVPHLQVRVA
ncbi:MAG: ion channel, partial [Polyangiaceae bacterium]